MVAATNRLNILDSLKTVMRPGFELNEAKLQEAADYINSGKHPKFPGAKQRVTVDQLKQAHRILSEQMADPNSKLSQGFNIIEKHSKELGAQIEEVKKQVKEGGIFARIAAAFKSLLAAFGFKKEVATDMAKLKAA